MQTRPPSKKTTFIHRISSLLWLVAIALIGMELFAYFLPQDLTRTTPAYARLVQISFFGRVLTFHAGLVIAVVATMATILRRWRLAGLAILSAAFLLAPSLKALLPHNPPGHAGTTFRLMSMNLKYAYDHGELITDQIAALNPDVLLLEDYTPFVQSSIEDRFAQIYPHRYLLPNSLQGLAIFSRFPFVGRPRITFTKTRRQLRALILFENRPIAIYVEHPYSPRTATRIISNRLSTVDLAYQLQTESVPVIAAGDFNFTAETPNEQFLKSAGLQDAFEQAGHGRGSTWPAKPQWLQWLPGVRIDHIFVSSQLTCTRFEVGKFDGSDHLPIFAEIAFEK